MINPRLISWLQKSRLVHITQKPARSLRPSRFIYTVEVIYMNLVQ